MNPDMRTLIIDSNFIGHQARYTTKGLSHDDIATGVIFGFLSRILSLGQKFKSNDLVFVWDSKHSRRKKIFPKYKLKRSQKTPEEIDEMRVAAKQFKILRRQILPTIGFENNYIQPGYEGDDIIASFVMGKLGEFIIVTADEDMYQCLQANTKMYSPSKRKVMTRQRFRNEYGIDACLWSRVKAIGGCTSDEVPGIRGVGQGTAIKYLLNTLNSGSKKHRDIIAGTDEIKLYSKLVTLPFPGTKEFTHEYNEFNLKRFKRVCKRYGMESFLRKDKLNEWKAFFRGEFE